MGQVIQVTCAPTSYKWSYGAPISSVKLHPSETHIFSAILQGFLPCSLHWNDQLFTWQRGQNWLHRLNPQEQLDIHRILQISWWLRHFFFDTRPETPWDQELFGCFFIGALRWLGFWSGGWPISNVSPKLLFGLDAIQGTNLSQCVCWETVVKSVKFCFSELLVYTWFQGPLFCFVSSFERQKDGFSLGLMNRVTLPETNSKRPWK